MKNRILIYGYHGMRNTGADSRLLAMRDILAQLVPQAELIVPSFHPTNLRYVDGVTHVNINPATYPWAAKKYIRAADVMILSEGNMLTDEFSKHLMRAFTIAVEQAKTLSVPSVGLALDSGKLEPQHIARVRDALNSMTLLTARSAGAKCSLEKMGVTVPITKTADCAVSMNLLPINERQVVRQKVGMAESKPIYGIAPVDFYMWPAVISLFGQKDEYVRWPFKGTWPDNGKEKNVKLVKNWATYANYLLTKKPNSKIALIAMEAVDERFCLKIREQLHEPERSIIISSIRLTPKQISACLEGLTSLATSRYHALVLSLPFAIPYIALGHDTRTRYISNELGIDDYFVSYQTFDLSDALIEKHETLTKNSCYVHKKIKQGFINLQENDKINYALLSDLLREIGYKTNPFPPSE